MKMATQTKRLVSEVVKLRAARARDLARYQEHLSQKVRALEANKVTIADMNLELAELRKSYDAKREHANALAAELARHVEAEAVQGVTKAMLEAGATAIATHWAGGRGAGSSITLARLVIEAAELARHIEARKAAGRPHPKGTRIDTPKNWALLNQRDEQWKASIWSRIEDLSRAADSLMAMYNDGPTPPAANATEKGTAADGMPEIRVTVPAEGRKPGDPVPGGNGVWYHKRKARKK